MDNRQRDPPETSPPPDDSTQPTGQGPDPLATEAALRVVIDTALAAVVTMDQDGRATGWSARAQEVFGWSRDDVLGKEVAGFLIPAAYREAHRNGLARYFETGEGPVLGQVLELSAMHRDGHEFPVEIRISPTMHVGEQTTFIAFIADITERRRTAENLDALYQQAHDTKEAMTSLISVIAHDVRTPLLVIAAYAELLQNGSYGAAPERWNEPLQIIATKTREVSGLVDKMLGDTRLDAARDDSNPPAV
jgi:PAS domain S-box-containing protein